MKTADVSPACAAHRSTDERLSQKQASSFSEIIGHGTGSFRAVTMPPAQCVFDLAIGEL